MNFGFSHLTGGGASMAGEGQSTCQAPGALYGGALCGVRGMSSEVQLGLSDV